MFTRIEIFTKFFWGIFRGHSCFLKLSSEFLYLPPFFQNRPLIWYIQLVKRKYSCLQVFTGVQQVRVPPPHTNQKSRGKFLSKKGSPFCFWIIMICLLSGLAVAVAVSFSDHNSGYDAYNNLFKFDSLFTIKIGSCSFWLFLRERKKGVLFCLMECGGLSED